MTDRKKVIAVLDDEAKMRLALARLLKTHGYDVAPFESGDDFLKAIESDRPDCMLLDLHMPRTTGFDVLESMFSMRVGVPIIVITGHDEPGNAERVRDLGAADYLLKPLDESVLIEAIERCAPTKETLAKVEALLAPLGVLETFRAYPGEAMMSALKEALARSDYSGFSRLTSRIAKAIITGSYRRSVSAWKLGEEGETELTDRLVKDYFDTGYLTKPYFEVLIVSDDRTPEQVHQAQVERWTIRSTDGTLVYSA